ncbi:MAG: hypothetical protein UT11_C0004G0014 [Berkelbacteria bacterium GW2011_GWA2_38_9]|uniref:Uncharacterized protein n=1 Tax=Berkelbacteria bacterium GW2011_GWA2_38_9 TaxID=1618334 RepID=A0A0G0LHH4_9BACT|nr:MAG: hypothetical protein UT11_C0004G0014 [Berkelbacteria bacterium GW2011_GWA2_38_9]
MINRIHPTLTQVKFDQNDRQTQSLMIAAELARAKTWAIKGKDKNLKHCLDRAFELIDLAISSPKWQTKQKVLLYFRDSLASIYENPPHSAIFEIFYNNIINLGRGK